MLIVFVFMIHELTSIIVFSIEPNIIGTEDEPICCILHLTIMYYIEFYIHTFNTALNITTPQEFKRTILQILLSVTMVSTVLQGDL